MLAQPAFLPDRLGGQVGTPRREFVKIGGGDARKPGAILDLSDPALINAEERRDVVMTIAPQDHAADQRRVGFCDGPARWARLVQSLETSSVRCECAGLRPDFPHMWPYFDFVNIKRRSKIP